MESPSLDEFLDAARADNPDVPERALKQYWNQTYGQLNPATLPSWERFKVEAAEINPGVPEGTLRRHWDDTYGVFGASEKEDRSSDVLRGAKHAFQQIPQTLYGVEASLGAAAEKVVGEGGIATGIKEHGVRKFEEASQKIAATSKPSDRLSTAYEMASEGDIGALADWLQYALGYTGGQALQMLGTAGVGYAAGKLALQPLASTVAQKLVAKEAARLGATEAGAQLAASELTKQATKNVAAKIGQTTALAATATGMEGGEIFGELVSQAEREKRPLTGEELAKAFGASLTAGALEFVGDKIGLELLTGKGLGRIPGRPGRSFTGAAAGLAGESATEFAQTLLEEYGKGNDPFSDAAIREALDAAALGAVGGTVVGGAGGALTRPLPPVTGVTEPFKEIVANETVGIDEAIQRAFDLAQTTTPGQKAATQRLLDRVRAEDEARAAAKPSHDLEAEAEEAQRRAEEQAALQAAKPAIREDLAQIPDQAPRTGVPTPELEGPDQTPTYPDFTVTKATKKKPSQILPEGAPVPTARGMIAAVQRTKGAAPQDATIIPGTAYTPRPVEPPLPTAAETSGVRTRRSEPAPLKPVVPWEGTQPAGVPVPSEAAKERAADLMRDTLRPTGIPERTKRPEETPIIGAERESLDVRRYPKPTEAATEATQVRLAQIAKERESLLTRQPAKRSDRTEPPDEGPAPTTPSDPPDTGPSLTDLEQLADRKGISRPVFDALVKMASGKTTAELTPQDRQKVATALAKVGTKTPEPTTPTAKKEQPVQPVGPAATEELPRSEVITRPRSELSPEQNQEMLLRAEKAQADLEIAGTSKAPPKGKILDWETQGQGGTPTERYIGTANAPWYKELTSGKHPPIKGDKNKSARQKIEEAIRKIIADQGLDRGTAVEQVKAALLDDHEFMRTEWGREYQRIFDEGLDRSPVEEEREKLELVDDKAHEAATSPENDLPEPSQAEKESGVYQKGHLRISGLDISIENPEGSERSGTDKGGKPWRQRMTAHYGYIRSLDKDGRYFAPKDRTKEHIDIFVKPGTPDNYSGPVFVVDQNDPSTGRFDEFKVMLGFATEAEAKAAYLANYAADWQGFRSIKPFTLPEFKVWLKAGNKQKPVGMKKPEKKSAILSPMAPDRGPGSSESAQTPPEPGRTILYHGSDDAEQIRRHGFSKHRVSRWGTPWVSTYAEADKDLAASIGELVAIDSSNLRIMPEAIAAEGPEDLQQFVQWVKDQGYDAFEHPQEAGEIGIVNTEKIRIAKSRPNPEKTQIPTDEELAQYSAASDTELFVRITGHPNADLTRTGSRTWDGDRHRHKGLSGFRVRSQQYYIPDRAQLLDRIQDNLAYFNDRGGYGNKKLVLYEGRKVGDGPDDEDLFLPSRVVSVFDPKDFEGIFTVEDFAERFPSPNPSGPQAGGPTVSSPVKEGQQEIPVPPPTVGSRPIIGREAQPEEAPLFSKAAQEADAEQTEIPTEETPASPTAILAKALRSAADEIEGKPAPIVDVGPKIGGARKDLAEKTGPKGKAATTDERPGWARRYEVNEIVAGNDAGKWALHDKRDTDFAGRPRQVGPLFDSKVEAERAIPMAAFARNHRVYRNGAGRYEILRKISDRKLVKVVPEDFDTEDAAKQYVAQHVTEIIETKTSFGEEILAKPDVVRRVGPERRNGKNVTAEDFRAAFSLRAVEFGKWENQTERQEVMNHAYDGLLDLAELLNIPPRAIGLNGELALAFGARGHGLTGARAHYERDYGVINLTKMQGAGSLSHEWFHSLDHYFARQDAKASSDKLTNERGDLVYKAQSRDLDYASYGFRKTGSGMREALREKYTQLIQTMFTKAEQYVEDAAKVERWVGETRNDLKNALDEIRDNSWNGLSKTITSDYVKRHKDPASAEHLAEWDTIVAKLLAGELLETKYTYNDNKTRRRLMSGRWTNDALEQLSAIYKAVRGRSGFQAEGHGPLDNVRDAMTRYSQRLKMLAEAQQQTTKTKQVPTEYAREAKSIDQGRVEAYWYTNHEMAARAFEAYVEDKLKAEGRRSDFLQYQAHGAVPTPWGWKKPYPEGEERKAINKAFDAFVEELQTRETDQGIALYQRDSTMDPPSHEALSVQSEIEGRTAVEAARFLATAAPSEAHRLIAGKVAEQLAKLEAAGMAFDLKIAHLNDRVPAMLIGTRGLTWLPEGSSTTQIWIQGADVEGYVGTSYETVLHELIHGATQAALHVGNLSSQKGTPLWHATQDLYAVGNAIMDHINGEIAAARKEGRALTPLQARLTQRTNAFHHVGEIVAWGLSSRDMQEYLESIPYQHKSLWTRFVEAIRTFLGLAPTSHTALSEVLRISEELLQTDTSRLMSTFRDVWMPTQINQYDGLMNEQPESSGLLNEQVALPRQTAVALRGVTDLTPAQTTALERVHGKPLTWQEKLNSFTTDWKTRLTQGLFDQYAPIFNYDQKAYMLARLSKGGDGTLEALLLYGKPYVDPDGAYQVDTAGGFAKVLSGLKGEHDRFFEWVAALRADRLKKVGLENLYSDHDIQTLKTLNQGTMKDGSSRPITYEKALLQLNEWNAAMTKLAVDSGLIDHETAATFKDVPYVPFYRLQEEGIVTGFAAKPGLVNQYAWKRLKGGTQHLNDDLLANVLQNWSHLITAAARNRAAKDTLTAAEKAGVAQAVPSGAPGKGLVQYMDGGKAKTFAVSDPALLDAITAMHYAGMGTLGKPFAAMKRALTFGVTVSPTFKIRNLIRDTIQAIGTADLSYNPFENLKAGFKALDEPKTRASLMAGGGMIRFGTMLDGNNADRARILIERGVHPQHILDSPNKIERFWKQWMLPVFEAYQELGDKGEQVNRAALYQQLRAKGVSHLEASYLARDLMDFSLMGKWEAVRILAQVVPFANARLQGLYKLGRAATEDYRRLGTVLGAVSLASLALLLAYHDDPDWQRREEWDRNNFWWFKIGDVAFHLPKPFELGAVGTLAERGAEWMFSDEMTGARFAQQLGALVSDQLSMNPTPQLLKPLLDLYANKDSFTDKPIETMGMERLRREDRYSDRTSELARLLGQLGLPDPTQLAMGRWESLSPVQLDHLVHAYFGWLGTSITTALDFGIRPLVTDGEKPAMKLKNVFLVGSFVESLPASGSRYVTQLYEQAKEVEQAYGSFREALKRGDYDRAREIQEEDGDKLRQYKRIERVKRTESEIAIRIKQIERSPTLSGDEKRELIDRLKERKHLLARSVAMREVAVP